MLLVIIYPKAGFELIFGFLSFLLPVFLYIRQRWDFDEKYDLSKTLTTHEQ